MKKNAYNHRLRLVESVRIRGIKPTARLFATSPFTVRKWRRRYQQLGPCDGGGADMGLGAISATLTHPDYNLLIVMYDNESYANTDILSGTG